MHSELRKKFKLILYWGAGLFLMLNAFSWTPGYGGRNDRKPGQEVERYFGWPACFRAELWQSDHWHEVNPTAFIPPVPLSSEMDFVYSSNSLVALALNTLLAACAIGIGLLVVVMEHRKRNDYWLMSAAIGLTGICGLIVLFADRTSAYL